ncbi:MAG: hypothetical protein ACRC92_14785 [Peptostreptococcaceae bacterium]
MEFKDLFAMESFDDSNVNLNYKDKYLLSLLEDMALECEIVNASIEVTLDYHGLEVSDMDITNHIAMEGIAETIKNKSSRAWSSFKAMGKKVFNYIFGFIINLFKGSINIKGTLKPIYKKAKEYDKKLNELVSKKLPEDLEMESKDYARRANASLGMIRTIIEMSQTAVIAAFGDEGGENSKASSDPIENAIKVSVGMFNVVAAVATEDSIPDNLIKEMQQSGKEGFKAKASKVYKSFVGFFKKSWEATKDTTANTKTKTTAKVKMFRFKSDPSAWIKALEKKKEKIKEIADKYSEEPKSATLKASTAIGYYKNQLSVFTRIVEGNNWDFEKVIKKINQVKVKSLKAIEQISTEGMDESQRADIEKNTQYAVMVLTSSGNAISSLTPLVATLLKNVKSDFDNLITEITKLGSKASKI